MEKLNERKIKARLKALGVAINHDRRKGFARGFYEGYRYAVETVIYVKGHHCKVRK